MRYNQIRSLDIANGPGCRVSLFVQGCSFNCPGCFNTVAKDFAGGEDFNQEVVNKLLAAAEPSYISGLSILGGEPLHPKNRSSVLELVKQFKSKYPTKTVWLWTGYRFEDIVDSVTDSEIDVIVDGQFVEELKDIKLQYRGSSNQRVISVADSIINNSIILYK